MGTWVKFFIDIIDIMKMVTSIFVTSSPVIPWRIRWNSNWMKGNTQKKAAPKFSERFEVLKLGLRSPPVTSVPSGFASGRTISEGSIVGMLNGIWWFLHPYFFRIRLFCLLLDLANLLHELFVQKDFQAEFPSPLLSPWSFLTGGCAAFFLKYLNLYMFSWCCLDFCGDIGLLGSSRFHEWRHCSSWRFLVTYHARGWGKVISGHPTVGCHHPSQPSWLWRTPRIKETLWCGEMCWVPPSHHPSRVWTCQSHCDFWTFDTCCSLDNQEALWLFTGSHHQNVIKPCKTRPPRGTSWVDRTCYCF